jgi:hypothetical protein
MVLQTTFLTEIQEIIERNSANLKTIDFKAAASFGFGKDEAKKQGKRSDP